MLNQKKLSFQPQHYILFIALLVGIVTANFVSPIFTEDSNENFNEEDTKVAVVVLDGADWKPLNQLREEERVGNIENFIEDGVHGNISSPYSFSPVSWTKAATGRDGKSVNIEDWNIRTEQGNQRMVRREDVHHMRMWEYLNQANRTVGISSWLLTWPVETVDGYMISGPLRTSDQDLSYPEEEFSTREKDIIKDGSEWKEAEIMLDRKGDLDFLALGMKNLDILQHHLWKFIEPEAFGMEKKDEHNQYREIVYTEYENLDRVLGEFDDEWNVLVFGTSGFEPENNRLYPEPFPSYALSINPLIEELGYAEFEQEVTRGTSVSNPKSGSRLRRCPLEYPMNDVFNSTTMQFRICILDEDLDVDEVKQDFESIVYQNGEKVFIDIEYREEKSDFIVKQNIHSGVIKRQEFRQTPTNQPLADGDMPYIDPVVEVILPSGETIELFIGPEKSGDHPPGTDSIFMARGPAVENGKKLEDGSISNKDITPTILYMYNLPIPEVMEGKPVLKLFNEDFKNSRSIRKEDISTKKNSSYLGEVDEERANVIRDRLRDIGYMVRER